MPAVIVSLTVERFGYNIYRFPTTLCISSGDMWFYSTTLPMNILVAAGVIMLIVIFWSIRKVTKFYNSSKELLAIIFLEFVQNKPTNYKTHHC